MPCSAKLKSCVDDLIAQGKPESSAWAICRSKLGETFNRHRDFERIYNGFISYYMDKMKGESEYYRWIRDLNLDESREYGAARESFQWAKDMLQYLREDTDNKYYQVLVGFPITSMNGNVYSERDLLADTETIVGKHPSLNHKPEFHFTPNSPWGAVNIHAAKFAKEDKGFGAVEVILQVPKTTRCPICNGAPMTELIDTHKIVNVSLEGTCKSGYGGVCNGFQFTDPPFTLLTADTLPGIPLARIKPLENIMVEALQSSTKTNKETRKVRKIEAKIKEEANPVRGLTLADSQTQGGEPMPRDGQTPEGTQWSALTHSVVPLNRQPDIVPSDKYSPQRSADISDSQFGEDKAKAVSGVTPAPDDLKMTVTVNKGWAKAPNTGDINQSSQSTPQQEGIGDKKGEPTIIQPGDPMPVPKDYEGAPVQKDTPLNMRHYDTYPMSKTEPEVTSGTSPTGPGSTVRGVSPVEALPSLEERVARVKAELQAKSAEEKALAWEQKHNEAYTHVKRLEGQYEGLRTAFDKMNERSINAERDRQEALGKYNEQCGLVTDLKKTLDKATAELNDTSGKYNKMLKTSLELNEKLTKANEDYLAVAKKNEDLEDKIAQMRKDAKKILRIKA